MLTLNPSMTAILVVCVALSEPVFAQHDSRMPTAERPMHHASAQPHNGQVEAHSIPEGMTLDEVLDYSAGPPPGDFPTPVPDDRLYAFTLFEQLEYRVATDDTPDHLGWEAQGWIGGDFNKFWWKNEGEAVFDGRDEGETETDLLYSRLIAPFWNVQIGAQYANAWNGGDYEDTWSAVIALQGLAPYKFELDNSLYISEHGDVSFAFEAEYNIRITQRLVLQPRAELAFFAQDIPEDNIGAGLSDVSLDLRLWYEIKRELAPYIGVRYKFLVGETDNMAEAAGEDTEQLFLLMGVRFAF